MHLCGGESLRAELSGQREAQRVGTPARDVLLVARCAVARAHRSRVELAAVPVVVAHLDGLREALGRVAAGSGRRQRSTCCIVLYIPRRPVEPRGHRLDAIAGRKPEQRRIVHLRSADDLARIHEARGIEEILDLLERVGKTRAELPAHPFGAHEAVAVLAGKRPFVFAHHGARLLGDRAHLRRPVTAQVEDRPHVQRADRRVRIPRAARAVPREHLRQPVDVLGQMLERHGAILDERDRLAVALQAHHDVEPGLAHVPQRLLRAGIRHFDHAARQAELAHQGDQILQAAQRSVARLADEFDEQDRFGLADQRAVDDGAERGITAREVDHRAIDELDRGGLEADQMPRALHRLVQGREIDDAERPMRRQRRELQRELARPGERAFAAHEEMRIVHAAIGGIRPLALRAADVEVVAADAAQHLWHAALDLPLLALADRPQPPQEVPDPRSAPHPFRARGRSAPRFRRTGSRRSRARCAPCCRRRSSASRTNCCPPCPPASLAPRC